MYTTTLQTPAGPFTVLGNDDAVLASGWTSTVDDLLPLVHHTLRPAEPPVYRRDAGEVTRAVRAYLDGDLDLVGKVPVQQHGGEFLQAAWAALRTVRPGNPLTYTDLAALAGRPAAARAAAQACARNPAALFVPCHRVVRTDGGLGGFRWGTGVKRWLLDHERVG